MPIRYRDLAAELRAQILAGDYPPGTALPTTAELARRHAPIGKGTITAAVARLEAEGLVRTGAPRKGVIVLDPRAVRVPLSRYTHVLTPGGTRGPWETACARQGVPGDMILVAVTHTAAPPDVAGALSIGADGPVVRRTRHAVIGEDAGRILAQVQEAWYPAAVAGGTPLAGGEKIVGGVYAALVAAGRAPATADETVVARPATSGEVAELHASGGMVLVVERVTRDAGGVPLEFLQVTADPARTVLIYDDLPLTLR